MNKTHPSSKEYVAVVSVAPLPNYHLAITLSNGQKGVYDASQLTRRGGIARALRAPEYFSQVKLFHTGVGWPNGFDISPHVFEDNLAPAAPENK